MNLPRVLADRPIGVFHVNGEFFAIENECPHAGASLAHGLISEETVACRIHHWRFCLRTGKYLDEDRPAMNVRSFPLRVVNGNVQIRLPDVSGGVTDLAGS